MKKYRVLMAALCAAFLLCGMTAPAYAYSDEPTGGYEETDPAPTDEDATVEEAPAPEPTIEPGEGFSEEGQFVTRDLLYDENTNKQFKKMKESCLNCKHKAGCLQRSTTIFMLFIATGRDEMVPEAQKNMNIRASCNRWAPAERTE